MIEAREILCSENPSGDRLMTMWCRYPKFVHCEHLRHRAFSFSVSSSRAIPVAKNLEEVRSDKLRAVPVWWGREQKGMQSGEELPEEINLLHDRYFPCIKYPRHEAKCLWQDAAHNAIEIAEQLHELGAHKSIINRLLEPFLHVNVIVSGTTAGWMNFFGLRLDKAAQPEIRALAEAQWRVWNESKPQKLKPGEWHLPFIDKETDDLLFKTTLNKDGIARYKIDKHLERCIKVSVARCARLSYMSFETGQRSTVEEDLALYDRLVGSTPIHVSPAEHQATPDEWYVERTYSGIEISDGEWCHPEQSGNFSPGWIQYRKTLLGESLAPLPEAYR